MYGIDVPERPARDSFTLEGVGLSIVSISGPRNTVLTVSGELDCATCPTFDQAVNRALRTGQVDLVIDLAGLEFLAVAGGHAFERTARRCRDAGGGLILLNPGRAVRRLLELFGMTGLVGG